MLKLAVGHSAEYAPEAMVQEIIAQCEDDLDGANPQAGIVLAATGLEFSAILTGLRRHWPSLNLIGCSSVGELSSKLLYEEDSVAVMLFASDKIEIRTGLGREVSKDPKKAASAAVKQAVSQCTKEVVLCITTPESLTTSSDAIVSGIAEALEGDVPIVGGTAGDNWKFENTYQFFDGEVLQDSVPVLLFAGPLNLSHGVASGWNPVGRRAPVTNVEGNVVHTIGDQRALDFYEHYLGKNATPSGEYPLAVLESSGHYYLRAPLGYDEDKGSVIFAGDIPLGSEVQISEASRDDVLEGVRASVKMASEGLAGREPLAALVFSCAARNDLLGTRTKEEIDALRLEVGTTLPFVGFYAYGEISPFRKGSPTRFHNETFITLLLSESLP